MNEQKTLFRPPYLGCAYYPEDWDESEIPYDISMMKKAGINCARIAEFAWHKMEPAPGKFEFGWLHHVVNQLGENGIAVVLGTPSATPPRWLSKIYPDVMQVNANGIPMSHGGRRHCCSNNPHYVEYSLRIAEAMAKEFADDPYVIGWQIDNEIYSFDGCFCPECCGRFAEYLREKYGDIETLNARWNLNLFSQAYDCFEDVAQPKNAWHNPHLQLDWKTFQNDSHIHFVHKQAEVLHRYVKVPVGTDTMPFNGMDYGKLNEKLDVIQFNHYNDPQNHSNVVLWFDYLRTILPHPFWNTETQTCWNGSVAIGQSIKPEGFCRVNSFMPLALGAEANMYWIWRTHWAGHELTHGSVLDASGRPMHIFGEVQDTAEMIKKSAEFINGTRVKTRVAFHYDSINWNMMLTQPVVGGMNNDRINEFYRPLLDSGLRPDVIFSEKDVSGYDLIFSPLMMTMEKGGLSDAMKKWVKDGGTWVVGPMTDIRNIDGARYQHKPFGMLEELTGAKWLYGIPDAIGAVKTAWTDGDDFRGNLWYDIFEPGSGAALVTVKEGHSAINGKACVLDCTVGKGHVIILGTVPSHDDLMKIISRACAYAKVPCGTTEGAVLASPRVGEAGEGVIVMEYSGSNPGVYHFEGTMTDILTGKSYTDKAELAPYEILVLKK
ncbi:MAG: beta-galactosidase [Clostridia bacterium]|nr:beta-galactosidase [Clostridia bacterium]